MRAITVIATTLVGSTRVHPRPQTRTKLVSTGTTAFPLASPFSSPSACQPKRNAKSDPWRNQSNQSAKTQKNSLGAGRSGGVCRTRSSWAAGVAQTERRRRRRRQGWCEARQPIMRPGAHVASQTDCIDRPAWPPQRTRSTSGPPDFGPTGSPVRISMRRAIPLCMRLTRVGRTYKQEI